MELEARLGTALDRGAGLHVLGGVDADQAHVGEVARGEPDAQRVAVDGVGDDGDTLGGVATVVRGAGGPAATASKQMATRTGFIARS